MNLEDAKSILGACRPDGQDSADPEFQEALELARREPDLARWWAEAQAWDRQVAAQLRLAIAPPAGLKSELLAQPGIVRPAPWWRQPAWAAAGVAASIGLLLTIGLLFYGPAARGEFTQYRAAMVDFLTAHLDRLDLESPDEAELRRWLVHRGAPADFVMPTGLQGRPALGCRLLEWKDRQVALICFELEDRQMVHLLVIERRGLRGAPAREPAYARLGEASTLAWSQGAVTYLLAGPGSKRSDLEQLL